MIDPGLNAAILTGINTLQAATLITDPMSKWALIGALQAANATCADVDRGRIECELGHIITERPITIGLYTRYGYLQADLEALS